MLAGSDDKRTPLAESRRLFENANEPKEFWVLKGAAHVDFHKFKGEAYERRVLDFFSRELRE